MSSVFAINILKCERFSSDDSGDTCNQTMNVLATAHWHYVVSFAHACCLYNIMSFNKLPRVTSVTIFGRPEDHCWCIVPVSEEAV